MTTEVQPQAAAAQVDPSSGSDSSPPKGLTITLSILVLAFLGGVTAFVVDHYGSDATSATGVLGAVMPGVTALLGLAGGAAAGAAAGSSTGKTRGRAEKAREVRQQLDPILKDASDAYQQLSSTLKEKAESPAGRLHLLLATPQGEPVELNSRDVDDLGSALHAAAVYVQSS